MNKLQKLLCLLLSLLLLASAPLTALAEGEEPAEADETAAAAEQEEVEFPEELIVGHPTVTKGDFFTELFGNDTADIDVRALIHGYNLVNWDQNQGTYVMDPSVVKDYSVALDENDNKIFTLLLWDDLMYSDGTPITAWDYAFSILLMMSPEVEAIGGKIYRAQHLLGYDEYIKTRKKILNGEELIFGGGDDADTFSLGGVHVLDDYQIEITLDHEFLPYFFETGLLMTVPYPIDVIAPGCKVYMEDGGGIYIGNADNEGKEGDNNLSFTNPVFTPELLQKTILDPETGYNSHPTKVSGPYTMVSWDAETGDGHYEINPYFKGAWMQNNLPGPDYSGPVHYIQVMDDEGKPKLTAAGDELWLVKPTIEKIKFVVADNETLIQQLVDGDLHLVNKVTYGPTIKEGLDKGVTNQNYPRIGLAFLTFTYDWPTVHDKEVRQAIAWCMDRDLMTSHYCGYANDQTGKVVSFGTRVDGYYGIEQWEYKLLNGTLNGGLPVNIVEEYIPVSDDPEEEKVNKEKREELVTKYKYLYVHKEDYEKAVAAWEFLAEGWNENITDYTVDLEKAENLLEKSGWTLNANGDPYQKGVDEVRCKKMEDGTLVALDLKMMYPEGNRMADIMMNDVRTENDNKPLPELRGGKEPDPNATTFVGNLASIGIKLTLVPAKMEDLLKSYYRETERTTDMIYLATNFHVIVDPSITYSTDDSLNHEIWNNTYSDDEDLFYRAKAMRETEPGDIFTYIGKWISFQERYSEVLPTIPVYSNMYFDFMNENLQNYWIKGQVTWSQAILPAYFALEDYDAASRQAAMEETEEAGDEDLEDFE